MEEKVVQHHPLYEILCSTIGAKYVRDGKHSLITYSKDMSSNPAVIPGIIVKPANTEEISEIVKIANRYNCPITIRGGGESANGVTKGVPKKNIVIDMGRLSEVSDIDIVNGCVTFGGGIRPSQVDEALKPFGYYTHTVLGPYYTDSMAGLMSGVSGAGYPKNMSSCGLNWHHLLGLKVVLPTGEVVTTGAGPDSNYVRDKIYYREASSPDFTGLFTSGGGSLGIITEISERIYKLPTVSKSFGYVFDTLDESWDVQLELSEDTPTPHTMFFLTDMSTMRMFGATSPGEYCIMMTVESYSEEDANLRVAQIDRICKKHGGRFGDDKINYFAGIGMTGTAQVTRDTSSQVCPFLSWESLYPRSGAQETILKLLDVFAKDPENNKKYEASRVFYSIPVENFILLGITMHWNDDIQGAGEYMLELWKKGAELLNNEGSCSTYTQGNNSKMISKMWTPAYHNLMKSIKKTLDPNNILCPGLWNL